MRFEKNIVYLLYLFQSLFLLQFLSSKYNCPLDSNTQGTEWFSSPDAALSAYSVFRVLEMCKQNSFPRFMKQL